MLFPIRVKRLTTRSLIGWAVKEQKSPAASHLLLKAGSHFLLGLDQPKIGLDQVLRNNENKKKKLPYKNVLALSYILYMC